MDLFDCHNDFFKKKNWVNMYKWEILSENIDSLLDFLKSCNSDTELKLSEAEDRFGPCLCDLLFLGTNS
jgi:hypothetical protein